MLHLKSSLALLSSLLALSCHSEFSPFDAEGYEPLPGQYMQFQMDSQTHTVKNVAAQRIGPPGITLPHGSIRGEFFVGDTAAYLDIFINVPNDTLVQIQQVMLRFGKEDNTAQYYRGGMTHTLKFVSSSVLEGTFTAVLRGLSGTPTAGKEKALKNGYLSVKYVQR